MDLLKIPTIRFTLLALIVIYTLGFLPVFYQDLQPIFANPFVQILLLIGVINLSYHDLPMSIFLAVAFILSIHFAQYSGLGKLFSGDAGQPGGEEWNDPSLGDQPTGYNEDKYCSNNWEFQCQGVNTFGGELNTQGLNAVQGYAHSADYSSANF